MAAPLRLLRAKSIHDEDEDNDGDDNNTVDFDFDFDSFESLPTDSELAAQPQQLRFVITQCRRLFSSAALDHFCRSQIDALHAELLSQSQSQSQSQQQSQSQSQTSTSLRLVKIDFSSAVMAAADTNSESSSISLPKQSVSDSPVQVASNAEPNSIASLISLISPLGTAVGSGMDQALLNNFLVSILIPFVALFPEDATTYERKLRCSLVSQCFQHMQQTMNNGNDLAFIQLMTHKLQQVCSASMSIIHLIRLEQFHASPAAQRRALTFLLETIDTPDSMTKEWFEGIVQMCRESEDSPVALDVADEPLDVTEEKNIVKKNSDHKKAKAPIHLSSSTLDLIQQYAQPTVCQSFDYWLPSTLGTLDSLDLSFTELSEKMVWELRKGLISPGTRVQELKLNHCSLSQSMLESLCVFNDIGEHKASVQEQVKFSALMQLYSIEMDGNFLSSILPIAQAVRVFDLPQFYDFISPLPAHLRNFAMKTNSKCRLQRLSVAVNRIRDIDSFFSDHWIPSLVTLKLEGNPCSAHQIPAIANRVSSRGASCLEVLSFTAPRHTNGNQSTLVQEIRMHMQYHTPLRQHRARLLAFALGCLSKNNQTSVYSMLHSPIFDMNCLKLMLLSY
jgi:hypothetical protein